MSEFPFIREHLGNGLLLLKDPLAHGLPRTPSGLTYCLQDGLDGLAFGQMPEGPRPLVGRLGRPITGRHACRVRAAASSQRGPTLSLGPLSRIYIVKQLQICHLSLNPYSCYIIGNKSVFIPDMSVYILQSWLPLIFTSVYIIL